MNISNTSLYTSSTSYISPSVEPSSGDETKDMQTAEEKTSNQLTKEEQQQVSELQTRDTQVRTHEAAHQGAGGGMTGGASFTYQQGEDGKMYAVGGEVSISMPNGSTPEEVIASAQQVIASALAPADPSSQDLSVASSARAVMIDAQNEKMKESLEEDSPQDKNSDEDNQKDRDEYILDTFA